MTKPVRRFILIDDDALTNLLSKKIILKNINNVEVKDFIDPELALEHIEAEFGQNQSEGETIIFLDINMPTLTGWEFLDKFERFSTLIKNQFRIYMLSSSVDPADVQRAKLNPLVTDFIEKPINKVVLVKLFKSEV